LTLSASIPAIQKEIGDRQRKGSEAMGLHNIVGYIVTLLSVTLCVQGFSALVIRQKVEWDDQKIRISRLIHKILGISIFLFAVLFVCTTGLFKWSKMAKRRNPKGPESLFGPLNIAFVFFL
jgi:hypothetical protein